MGANKSGYCFHRVSICVKQKLPQSSWYDTTQECSSRSERTKLVLTERRQKLHWESDSDRAELMITFFQRSSYNPQKDSWIFGCFQNIVCSMWGTVLLANRPAKYQLLVWRLAFYRYFWWQGKKHLEARVRPLPVMLIGKTVEMCCFLRLCGTQRSSMVIIACPEYCQNKKKKKFTSQAYSAHWQTGQPAEFLLRPTGHTRWLHLGSQGCVWSEKKSNLCYFWGLEVEYFPTEQRGIANAQPAESKPVEITYCGWWFCVYSHI